MVTNCFGAGYDTPDGEEMVMSDIFKWDATMPEVLISHSFDLLEGVVDKSSMSPDAVAARSVMCSVAKRQLMTKLLEHPSGYLVELFGCMPSGSYYTSLLNTEANNLLLLSHIIDRAVAEVGYTTHEAALILCDASDGLFGSYGDNQLFSAALFKLFGLKYDSFKHAAYLAQFGMIMKPEETEVTTKLGRVRYCSRAVVMTPHGPLLTRTHSSLVAKMAGRPEHDPLTDKLYVRAIMADFMGTDPIAYAILSHIDSTISVPIAPESVTVKTRPVIEAAAQTLLGDTSDESILAVLQGLSSTVVERRALLSLHTRRGDAPGALGTSLTVGGSIFGGPLTPAAEWALEQTPESWGKFLCDTKQEGILYD
jgi:hypothetical protein